MIALRLGAYASALVIAGQTHPTLAQNNDEPQTGPDIVVYGRAVEQIGVALSGSEGTVGYADFERRPLLRSGELVETVPGIIATQHSGAGKANQYFLRGFNLDHGTDFSVSVDGIPVNMRSHGHGQGYLDVNFLIPELVERVDYAKGPYLPDAADFSAAGSVRMTSYSKLSRPFADLSIGSYGYVRAVAAGSTQVGTGDLLIAAEGATTNGPWVLDEDLRRANGMLSYAAGATRLTLQGYSARWTSTDQIPSRAIADGRIDRLGAADDDLGGKTSRYSIGLSSKIADTDIQAYAIAYRLRLTSNFTYFASDPVNGDEFQQQDRRVVLGASAKRTFPLRIGDLPAKLVLGAEGRYDAIGKVGLYSSRDGEIIGTVREDSVDQWSIGSQASIEASPTSTVRIMVGGRLDAIGATVDGGLPVNAGSATDAQFSPKLAIAWKIGSSFEAYANYGESFHSNDARGATISIDPVTGDPADRVDFLSRARGAELGLRYESDAFNASLVGFWTALASELVFVGDAGTTEPNAASRRTGIEASLFWRPINGVAVDASLGATKARYRDVGEEDRIPGSIGLVVGGGITGTILPGLSATVRVRHFGAAPLIEDGTVRSRPTTLANAGLYADIGNLRISADVYNLFDSKDADITYFYGSRLADEADIVDDVHLHPVEPRQLRVTVRLAL